MRFINVVLSGPMLYNLWTSKELVLCQQAACVAVLPVLSHCSNQQGTAPPCAQAKMLF